MANAMSPNDNSASRVSKKRAGRKRLPPLAPGPALQFVVASHPDDFRAGQTMRHIRSHVMYKHREDSQGRSQSPSNRASTQRSSSTPLGRTPSPRAASGSISGERTSLAAACKCWRTGVDAEFDNLLFNSYSASPLRNLTTQVLLATTADNRRDAPPASNPAPYYPYPELYGSGGQSFAELKEEYIRHCEICQDRLWLAAILHPYETFLSAVSANCVYLDASEGLIEDSPLTVYTKAKVLHLVKERLQDPRTATDNHTALSILHLLISEIGASDEDVFDLHYQGLGRIVQQRGGLRSLGLDGHVSTLISIVVLSFAILRGHGEPAMLQGFYPHLILPGVMTKPPPISPLFAPNGDTSMLYGLCAQATYEILTDMHELTRLFLLRSELHALSHHSSAEAMSHDARMRQIYSHLLLRPSAEDGVAPDWTYEACRLAALIYCRSIVQRVPFSDSGNVLHACGASPNASGTTILRALHNSINHTDRTNNWANLYGVFLWVCLVGGAASWPQSSSTQSVYSGHETAQAGVKWTRKCFALLTVKSSLAGGFEQAAAVLEAQRKMLRVQHLILRPWNLALG